MQAEWDLSYRPDERRYWGISDERLYPLLNILFRTRGPRQYNWYGQSGLFSEGIPLQLQRASGGTAPSGFGSSAIEHYRREGHLLARPLRPTDQPLEALAALEASANWPGGPGTPNEPLRRDLMNQLLRLIEPVYPLAADRSGDLISRSMAVQVEERWNEIRAEVAALDLRWDPRAQGYRAGGQGGRRDDGLNTDYPPPNTQYASPARR